MFGRRNEGQASKTTPPRRNRRNNHQRCPLRWNGSLGIRPQRPQPNDKGGQSFTAMPPRRYNNTEGAAVADSNRGQIKFSLEAPPLPSKVSWTWGSASLAATPPGYPRMMIPSTHQHLGDHHRAPHSAPEATTKSQQHIGAQRHRIHAEATS
jgi:hypothetical protein